MNDTLWAVAQDLRNEVCDRIENQPLPEYPEATGRRAGFSPRRLAAAALVAGVLVIFHALVG